jgi:hypothetical protein
MGSEGKPLGFPAFPAFSALFTKRILFRISNGANEVSVKKFFYDMLFFKNLAIIF